MDDEPNDTEPNDTEPNDTAPSETGPTGIDPTARLHDTVEVEPDVVVGARTTIWRQAHLRRGARVGADANIGANVFVDAGVRIGDRVRIQNNVSVYAGVELADETFVGPAAVFTNDRNARAVGDWQLTPTFVERGATVGANATVVCGVTLGEHCLVGAGTVVVRSVLAHQVVVGNPARHAGWACRCGLVVSHADDRPDSLDCARCPHEHGG